MNLYKHNSYTIGFLREDYSFEVLATLNNNGGLLGSSTFSDLIDRTLDHFQKLYQDNNIVALPRQDTPDLINLEDEELEKHFNINVEAI